MVHHQFVLFASRRGFRFFLFSVAVLLLAGFGLAGMWNAGKTRAAFAPAAPLMSSCTTPSFGAATNFAVGTGPKSVAVGDFNRDGKPDLATANPNSTNISVLLGNGAGSFGAANNISLIDAPQSIAAGDFNRDGNLDLTVANPVGDDVSLLLGNGAGGFGAPVAFGTGMNPSFVAVGDFNRDGNLDLVTTNQLSDSVSVLLGNGAGNFAAATDFGVGSQPISVAVGDFNLDGISDLAVANLNSDNVSLLLGLSGGSFDTATNFAAGDGPSSVAMGDFNLDGKPDLAVVLQTPNSVAVLLGNGAGSFGAPANFGVGSLPLSVAVADANLDGKPDLAVANALSNNVSVLLGNGAGSFGAATNFGTATRPEFVAVSDFNLDGRPDLAAANNTSNNVSVLLNTCNGTPCVATNFGAATNFNAGTQPNSVVNGDFNQDGSLDLAVANVASNNVSVYLGNGAGSFGAATNFSVGTAPLAVTAADFNLDGNLDLATANSQSANISILLGNGLGSFGAAANFAFSNQPASIAVADFNRDGKPDIVTANANGGNVTVYQGDGMGSFGPGEPYSAGNGAFGVAVGDFNLDGKADVAVANLLSNNVSVLLGNGMGGLGAATNFAVGNGPGFVQVGDFNQDGKPDLAVANTLNPSTTVSVLLGNGAGSFGAATNFTVGAQPFGLAIGDYNRDGKPDIATANGGSDNISVIVGNGAGSFGAATNFAVGTTPQGLAAGDFNRDGKTDLVATNYNSNNITVRLNACVSNTPPNLNVLGPLTISQGSNNNLNIALATDPDQANNTLILSVTPLTGSGVSYTGFSSGIGGTNAAIVIASCTATNSTFQLTVTDNQGAMVSGVQTVNVTPNTAPTLGQYGNTALTFGQNTTVIPNAVPADNGTVNTLTATAPGFTGTFNANVTTGVVTVTNAGPIGSHTVTVTATDNCGTNSTRTFTMTVTSPMATGCATPSFGAATNFAVSAGPFSAAVGDFNLDGKPDLATANESSNNVSVVLGDGTGSFGAATNFAVGTAPNSVKVGDFNRDGKPDLAVANSGSDNVSVLLGNGSGGFGTAVNFNAGTNSVTVAVGDFNQDGNPDLAVANFVSSDVSVLLGNGAGSFGAAVNFGVGNSPRSVVVGDFNQDGKLDLATANQSSNDVSVLLGNGAGSFGAATNFAVGNTPVSIAVGDFNLDGRLDLAALNQASNNVSVLLGNGAGSFSAATNFITGATSFSLESGDFNQDGKPDLAVGNFSSANVLVLLGNGVGGFGAPTNFVAGNAARSVVVGDFNLDGRPDLATANFLSNNVSVLLNTCAGTPCSGASFAGATNFAAGTQASGVAAGDFNLDGKPDLAVANSGSANVSVMLANGAGSFGAATNFAVGSNPRSVAVSDFNQDGKPDIATSNSGSNNVSVLLGDGAGGFGAATNFAVGNSPQSVAVGDFNLDGKPDLAASNSSSSSVSVLLGNGAGSFGAATNFTVQTAPFSVAVGDFNLDGKPDFAAANYISNTVSVRLGNGAGSFGAATNFAVVTRPINVAVGDFNQDGKPDLATANDSSADVSVLLGNGAGSFGAATTFPVGANPRSIAVGDFNRDGKPDLAVANNASANVSMLLGNGAGSFSTATNFAVGSGPQSVAAGDFNLDGKPDLATANFSSNNASVLLSNCFSGAQTLTVNTTADTVAADGFCSLREAIQAANTNTPVNECASGAPGLDNITFNLGAGTPSIAVTSGLPLISEALSIDGATGGATRVELNGTGAGAVDGLFVTGDGSTIKSLVINRFAQNGIQVNLGNNITVQNCFIGTNATGAAAQANGQNGVLIAASTNNLIGGAALNLRNVIAGNGAEEIFITGAASTGNQVQGNLIGTNAAGTAALASVGSGVSILNSPNNLIGGATLSLRNVIAGNDGNEIFISGAASTGNQVQGNLIGTNATGTAALASAGNGVRIQDAPGNTIGGSGARLNVISGNNNNGVDISGATATGNQVLGNIIGADANGLTAIPNGANGVSIVGASNNIVGSTTAGLGNVISGNAFDGVVLGAAGATGNQVLGNLIGLKADGSAALANRHGIFIDGAPSNTVGGTAAGARNVISGNTQNGVFINGSATNQVQGNFIGTNADATAALGNGNTGVLLSNAAGNTVGGTTAAARNIISGNTQNGVAISGASATGNQVQGNFIGTNGTGTLAIGNSTGVTVFGPSNTIGGTAAGAGNLISGNSGFALVIGGVIATGNQVQGNVIGLDVNGAALGNADISTATVLFQSGASNNVIGGTVAGARNVISGNNDVGIGVIDAGTDNNQILGNYIGLAADGSTARGNNDIGVLITGGSGTIVGGTAAGARNVISSNTGSGVSVSSAATNAQIIGNFIGTDAGGNNARGNTTGISINNTSNNLIGGTTAGSGNLIAFNTGRGVSITGAAANNRVLGNSISGNNGLGIDLGSNGLTVNDAGDADTGANNLQNFPLLTTVTTSGGATNVAGTLNSTPSTVFRIEFFANVSCDATGNGEGQFFIGSTDITTDAGGNATISATFPSLPTLNAGGVVTATATDAAGNTSEFSPCVCNFAIDPTEAGIAAQGVTGNQVQIISPDGCSWTAVSNSPFITVTGGASGSGNGTVTYNVAANPGTQPRTGSLTIAGYTFFATQAANGTVLNEGFGAATPKIPDDWSVMDTGGTNNGGDGMTWMAVNSQPCPQTSTPGAPFSPPYATVDFSCVPPQMIPDESLVTPPFDARGLNQVILQFDSFFRFQPGDLTVRGDVDISLDRELTWTNILRLTASETANTRTLNLTPFIPPNSADVRVRFRFYAVAPPPVRPNAPRAQELSWGIDAPRILALTVAGIEDLLANGETRQVQVIAPAEFGWTVTEEPDAPWLTIVNGGNRPVGLGTGTFTISTEAYGGICPRVATLKVAIPGAGPTPLLEVSRQVRQVGSGLSILPASAGLPLGRVGQSYSQSFSQTGSNGTIEWSVASGSLPAGLTLNQSSGVLSGTPTLAGDYGFSIQGLDSAANGCIGKRAYTLTIVSAEAGGLQFFPLPQPVRLLETRAGLTGCTTPGAIINAGGTFTLPARTTCAGIPADAQAVTGNITVVPSGGGFLTLFPSSAAQPTVANSNFGPGEVTNNVFTVGLGAGDGAFKIFASGTTHVIVDVTGYYAPPAAGGLYFHPLATPVRLLETRAGLNGCIAPGAQLIGTGDPNADPNLDFAVQGRSPVASPCNSIPASAQVLVGNATSVVPDSGGYLTIYPSGGTRPLIASSNYVGSDVINGPFSVKLGADGKFKIYTLRTTHLVVDILGYYSEEAVDANGVGLLFSPLPVPVRLLETRPGGPPLVGCTRTNAPIQGNLNAATHTQQAAGFCGLPASAQAVVGNVSVVSTPGAGFLTLFPGNLTNAPLVATSNYPTPAAAGYNRHYFVGLSPIDGTFKVLTQFTTELILDASGYFAP